MPALGSSLGWSEGADFDWLDTLVKFRRIGLEHNQFFRLALSIDPRNTSDTIIQVSQIAHVDNFTQVQTQTLTVH